MKHKNATLADIENLEDGDCSHNSSSKTVTIFESIKDSHKTYDIYLCDSMDETKDCLDLVYVLRTLRRW